MIFLKRQNFKKSFCHFKNWSNYDQTLMVTNLFLDRNLPNVLPLSNFERFDGYLLRFESLNVHSMVCITLFFFFCDQTWYECNFNWILKSYINWKMTKFDLLEHIYTGCLKQIWPARYIWPADQENFVHSKRHIKTIYMVHRMSLDRSILLPFP